MSDLESGQHIKALIRNAPAEGVVGVDDAVLLRLLSEGPRDEVERWALVSVLAGHRARPRLEMLVRAGVVPAHGLWRVVRQLTADGDLRRDRTGRSPKEWVAWADETIRPIGVAAGRIGRIGNRRGRKPADKEAGAQSTVERSRRYAMARRAEGEVRRSVWLTAEAAGALQELIRASDHDTDVGSIVSQAILAFHRLRSS